MLFTVAWRADRQKSWLQRFRPLIYSLALAVYCSSWTFFGAVEEAIANNWSYLPIYLGPALLFLLGGGLLSKLVAVGERHKITSVADFIGSRYGKSQWLSALVTVLAIIGSLPYIALQLRAVAMIWDVLAVPAETHQFTVDSALVTALLMGAFAMWFGTRHLEGRERNRGMMAAIALESVVKLLAFMAVALVAIWWLWRHLPTVDPAQVWVAGGWQHSPNWINYSTQTLLAALAILCLPRQFHMAVVEFQSREDLQRARWVFPAYLLLFALLILPVAFAGDYLVPTGENGESLALTLPMLEGHASLAMLAFLGGFSAATGMVVVASVALAIMISNELVAPLWLKFTPSRVLAITSLGNHLRLIRRISIVVLLLLAWLVHRAIADTNGLAAIGLLAFAAAAQLAPAIIAALYWRRAHRYGVLAGLIAGYSLWFFCLALPELQPDHPITQSGLWNTSWLRPQNLFGTGALDPLSHGVFWSLLVNILLFAGVSLRCHPSKNDLIQADAFLVVSQSGDEAAEPEDFESTPVHMDQIRSLMEPLVGRNRLNEIWADFEQRLGQRLLPDDWAPGFVVQEIRTVLAGIMGAATAERALELLYSNKPLEAEDFAGLINTTSQQLHFSQHLLQTTVETMSQGISVVDADLRLVAWNEHYAKLFNYPDHLLYVGCPVQKLYEYNAAMGIYDDLGELGVKGAIQRRVEMLRSGGVHRFERQLPNGVVVEVQGNPMPGGGFVTTYNDISSYKTALTELEEARQTLELRVTERTRELRELHAGKTRFLAHTSHDLLQPVSAARLFTAALEQKMTADNVMALRDDVNRIDNALAAAEELIKALREISRLDTGDLTPKPEHFQINELLQTLVQEFAMQAEARDLELRYQPCSQWVYSDPYLLRRILQNFLSNAVRYTRRGKVLLGCRRRKSNGKTECESGALEIQIWDTGPGIPAATQAKIFDEFVRFSNGNESADKGLGLGLAVAKRSANLLRHQINLVSSAGSGAMFSIIVPLGNPFLAKHKTGIAPASVGSLSGITVLCIDNDSSILEAIKDLLTGWGCEVNTATGLQQALASIDGSTIDSPGRLDVVIADYHLDDGENGIDVLDILGEKTDVSTAILVSADISGTLRVKAKQKGYYYLSKPVKPAALRSIISRVGS